FCIVDQVTFTWKFIFLVYPIVCLVIFNIGVGLILSAAFLFFRDIQYLWGVFTQLLMYLSAVFYRVEDFTTSMQQLFLLNPVYCYIKYFRIVVLEGYLPTFQFHLLCAFYAFLAVFIGGMIYKKNNHKFLYYI
ncbi:MAG: ABC transporter permease, partial [Lachnospiraceae bacterium]|nr:ABC transporter permease [Lachnospiraceae bacterium]